MTIAELIDRYWPEGCHYFKRKDDRHYFQVGDTYRVWLESKILDPNMLNIIAAVAVAWFEDQLRELAKHPYQFSKRDGFLDAIDAWRSAIKWE